MDLGTLHLPTERPAAIVAAGWADIPEHGWVLIGAAVIILFLLPEIYKLFPALAGCLARSRGNLEVEHSVSTARSRNTCARLLSVTFIVAADRYALYNASFLAPWSEPWLRLAELAAVLVAFNSVRLLMHALLIELRRNRPDHETRLALRRGIYNYFICFVLLMLISLCVLVAFRASDIAIRWCIWGELAMMWLVALVREGQILSSKCGGLSTFLYLCGLEIIPAAVLIASGLVL